MQNNRLIAVVFELNEANYVTLLDNRSRTKFRKLIKNWGGAKRFNIAKKGDTFQYIPLNDVLNDIESMYKNLENTPATEKIAKNVFGLINHIRTQNDMFLDDEDYDDEE